MSLKDVSEALDIINQHPSLTIIGGPCDAALVAEAEAAIGSRFPPTYREFLTRLGSLKFAGLEIYGITKPKFERPSASYGVWITLNERRTAHLPKDLLVVGDDGMGGLYCIELRDGKEGNVIVYGPDASTPIEQPREFIANDFGEFLLSEVRQHLEWAANDDSDGDE